VKDDEHDPSDLSERDNGGIPETGATPGRIVSVAARDGVSWFRHVVRAVSQPLCPFRETTTRLTFRPNRMNESSLTTDHHLAVPSVAAAEPNPGIRRRNPMASEHEPWHVAWSPLRLD
jgi:hypothetical protein